MPEHVHLIVQLPLGEQAIAGTLIAIKRPFSEMVLDRWRSRNAGVLARLGDPPRFWQPGGGYDRTTFADTELREKVQYIHMNPVRRGLISDPLAYERSSSRAYAGLPTRWPEIDRDV
jgi:putative transposase